MEGSRIMSFKIGIVGNGFVGSAISAGFLLSVEDVLIYDKNPDKSLNTLEETVNGSDVVFVSVPTPMRNVRGGSISLEIMDTVMGEISQVNRRSDNVIVVKSTVVPGTVERYIDQYPDLNIVFNPEFLTERAARLDFINSARVVLGGDEKSVNLVEKLYRSRFPHVKVIKTDPASAQFIKYMANCFFSVKVSFMNEMYQACEKINGNWDDILDGFISDGRIGNSHIDVPGHDGSLGFGGKCFPKDLNAFIHFFDSIGVNPELMKSAWKKNLEVRDNFDWAEIEGAVE
jgi:UDPglucose 6-dehydrogenase